MLPLPTSDHAWIADLLDGLRRRSRALKYKMHSVECERVIEEADGERTERIDLTLRQSRSRQGLVLRAKIWEDRWAWVDARAGGKSGWTMEWTVEGRAAGGVSGRAFITSIEETFDAISIASAADAAALNKMWQPILLRGPKPI
jgi:hypothetical protein